MAGEREVRHEDVEVFVATRADLGPAYDSELVDGLAERIEAALEQRVGARLAEERRARKAEHDRDGMQLALGIVSLGCGIPISGVAAATADLPGLVVAWAGIVGVNLAYAVRGRRRG